MKTDKFLISIVIGIVLLVVVAVVLVLARSRAETYLPDDTPEGVAHNYFLAIQRQEFEKAYNYLADDLKSKPDLDTFIQTVDNNNEASLALGQTNLDNQRARVSVSITNYYGGGPFDSGRYTNEETAYLRQDSAGNWKITQYPYPYWGYDWDEDLK
jgi:hypothetical protein